MARPKPRAAYAIFPQHRDAECLVCGESVDGTFFDTRVSIHWGDVQQDYAFPMCSVICADAWGEEVLRAMEGDKAALHRLVEATRGKGLDD